MRSDVTAQTEMPAVVVKRFGGPKACRIDRAPVPGVAPDHVLVELAYAGVNFIDVYMRNGSYARSATYRNLLPMTLGMEGAGRVVSVGADVEGLSAGDRVAYAPVRGSYARYAAVPAWRAVKVPDSVGLDVACALMLQGFTAHYLTHSAFPLAEGDWCLVHAAAGGVGQLLTQLAKRSGATVIATVGTPEKAEIAKARGADHVVLYREVNFRKAVDELTGGRGVDVAYDSVGKDTIEKSIRCVRRRGLCVLYGASSGQVECVNPMELAEAGSVFLTRPHLADYIATREEVEARADDLFSAVEAGALKVTIDRVFPLALASHAHRMLEAGLTRGKLLLEI